VSFTPVKKLRSRLDIGGACVLVADVGRKEFEKVLASLRTRTGDNSGHGQGTGGKGRENFRGAHPLPVRSIDVESLDGRHMTESGRQRAIEAVRPVHKLVGVTAQRFCLHDLDRRHGRAGAESE
jgi:hypothetical protein